MLYNPQVFTKKKYDTGNAYFEMLSKKYVNYVMYDVKYIFK